MLVPRLFTILALITATFSIPPPVLRPRDPPSLTLAGPEQPIAAGTYPRAVHLGGNNLLLAYTAFSDGQNILRVSLSTDNGNTWTPQGTITTGVGDIDNPQLLRLPSGRILAAFRNHSRDPNGRYTVFRITVCTSTDNGATWSFRSQPAIDNGPVTGNWEPFMRVSAVDPRVVQLFYSRENAGNDQDSLMRTSTDEGATWSSAAVISGGDVTARDGMLGVAQMPGGGPGSLIAVFESGHTATGGDGHFTIDAVVSNDDGRTWGERRTVYTAKRPGGNANAPQIVLESGALVMSFMTDEDWSGNGPLNAKVKVITSPDGQNWSPPLEVFGPGAAWAGLLEMGVGSVLVFGDSGGVVSRNVRVG